MSFKYPEDIREFEALLAGFLLDKNPSCIEMIKLVSAADQVFDRYLKMKSKMEASEHDRERADELWKQYEHDRAILEGIKKASIKAERENRFKNS